MAYVIVGGTGSYSTGRYKFKSGANPCDDEATLERIRKNSPKWVTVQETLEAPTPEKPKRKPRRKKTNKAEKKATPDPYQKYRGRDGKWYYHSPSIEGSSFKQVGPFADEKAADESIIAAKEAAPKPKSEPEPTPEPVGEIPLAKDVAKDKGAASGTFTSEDLQSESFTCHNEDCEKVFQTSGERANHERVAHPKRRITHDA